MKPETKFWQEIKKNLNDITWTRLESWSSFGVPDLLGYHDSCAFFMCELKIERNGKVYMSPHQILFHRTMTKRNFILVKQDAPRSVKLYKSSAVTESGLVLERSNACALDDWSAIRACLLERSHA
jgi:Holliday junction resolvase